MNLYYRHRKNGVVVFRMEVANRQRRIELNQIASIAKTGDIIPHKRRPPTEAETAEMSAWWTKYKAREDAEALDGTEAFQIEINRFTEYMQKGASDEEVNAQSDALLMALLDLRQVVVRRLSNIDSGADSDDADTDSGEDETHAPPKTGSDG